jgi:hypothetical protein
MTPRQTPDIDLPIPICIDPCEYIDPASVSHYRAAHFTTARCTLGQPRHLVNSALTSQCSRDLATIPYTRPHNRFDCFYLSFRPSLVSTIAVSASPSRTSQRPDSRLRGMLANHGSGRSRRAEKAPRCGSKASTACSKPSERPASGNQALYTDSLALNSRRSQWIAGATCVSSRR